jgi:beta-lactamase regulating signal transducer with metallopeptidase domain
MIAYILKSSLSLLLLFGLYWFLLRREKLFIFIRYFLLFSILLSLVLPFISIPLNIPTNGAKKNIITILNGTLPAINHKQNPIADISKQQFTVAESTPEPLPFKISFTQILLIVYILGLILSLFRFTRNIFKIKRQVQLSESTSFSGRKLVLIDNQINPYCFFNTIFVYKHDYLNNKIAKEFLTHELEHIKQSHSTDILVLELIRIVYWFNPILYLYSQAIRVNHEYLADSGVLRESPDIEIYVDKLLSLISNKETIPLTSGMNQSIMKKRLLMITKPKSKRINYGLRITLTLCMILVFFLFLSFKPSNTQPVFSLPNHKDAIDTLLIDEDSLKTSMSVFNLTPQSSNIFDKKVTFTSSGYIRNDTINQTIVLVDNAIVSFGEITIKADSIVFNFRTNQIYTTGRQSNSGTIIGKPIFKEGSQEFTADEITYNLKTRKAVVKNIKAQINLNLKDSGSLDNFSSHKQIGIANNDASNPIGNEDQLTLSEQEKPVLFPNKKDETTEIEGNFGEKNNYSNTSDFLFLNSEQLKPLGIELNKNGVFYKNLNPNWKQDKVRYSGLSFYCSSNNYLTSKHYSEKDVIKAKNRSERLLGKMEITNNDFYPILIGNPKGKKALNNETLPEELKLFPVAICMSETKLQNRKDTIVVWFKPSESLKKVLPENVNIEDYLRLPIKTK